MEEKKKRPDRLRKRVYHLHLLDEEDAILKSKADKAGMTKARYLRNVILYGAAHERTLMTKEESKKFLHNLTQISNRIEQIAWRTKELDAVDKRTLEDLTEQYDLLKDAMDDIVRF